MTITLRVSASYYDSFAWIKTQGLFFQKGKASYQGTDLVTRA